MTKRLIIKRSALKRLKKSYRKDTQLLGALTRHVMRKLNDPNPERRTDVMHPSDMSKPEWCPRFDYHRLTEAQWERPKIANPSFTMSNALTEGTNIHGKYQTWLWEMGVLWGVFSCDDCEHRWEALSPWFCPKCESANLHYREVPFYNEQYMIGGHADGAVHGLLRGVDPLIEIKSIGIRTLAFEAPRLYEQYQNGVSAEDIWFQIKRPFGSHLKQGMLYVWLSNGKYDTIIFVYESKFTQQVKEFVVKYNRTLIANVLEEAKDVAQGVRSSNPPDRPVWAAPDGPICQNCGYRSTCWSIGASNGQDDSPKETLRIIRSTGRKRKAHLDKTRG